MMLREKSERQRMVRASIAKNGIFSFAKIECLKKVFFTFNCHSLLIISSCATASKDCHDFFITDAMLEEIANCMKAIIAKHRLQYANQELSQVKNTCQQEIKALMGLLIFNGFQHDNHLTSKKMFKVTSTNLHCATMTEYCF